MKQNKILKNLFFGSFLLLFMLAESKAQNVFTGNVLLQSQSQVVEFGANNYTQITGNLEIRGINGSGISDLSPLLSLNSILGDLTISTIVASSLNGLNNIVSVRGNLGVENNPFITNIDELSDMWVGKSILFINNTELNNLDGFSSRITTVNGDLDINMNATLTNIDGLSSINYILGGLTLFDNSKLTNLDGLINIKQVRGGLDIQGQSLINNIDGLSNISSIGTDIIIGLNPLLTNLNGLIKLSTLGGNLSVASNILLDSFCGLFTLLNGGLAGTYTVTGNASNPTMTEIVIGGSCNLGSICLGDVTLTTQAEVNDFICTEITGSLRINGNDITDLSPLLTLTSVSGLLRIGYNPLLNNLDGLNNITTIGGDLILEENNVLNNIDALSALTSVNSIQIQRNKQITNLDCFSNITSVESINLFVNEKLSNIDGLSNITSASAIQLSLIPITNLNAFRNITSLDQYFHIVGTLINNLDGLDGLTSIGDGGLYIASNTLLTSLDKLSGLTTIGGGLGISSNPLLSNLNGLDNLTSVGDAFTNIGGMQIAYNDLLTDFCGLFTLLNSGGLVGIGFAISNVPAQRFNITGNLINPTEEEIIAGGACTTVAVEKNFSLPSTFELSQNYPNPFNPITTIAYAIPYSVKSENAKVKIVVFDILGNEVATLVNEQKAAGTYKLEFDASGISSGIYFYTLKTGNFIETKKMLLMK